MTAERSSGEPQEDCKQECPIAIDGDISDQYMEAYSQLNQELDEINNFLDALEQKNDNLHEQIFKLLEESKQIRSELKESESSS